MYRYTCWLKIIANSRNPLVIKQYEYRWVAKTRCDRQNGTRVLRVGCGGGSAPEYDHTVKLAQCVLFWIFFYSPRFLITTDSVVSTNSARHCWTDKLICARWAVSSQWWNEYWKRHHLWISKEVIVVSMCDELFMSTSVVRTPIIYKW